MIPDHKGKVISVAKVAGAVSNVFDLIETQFGKISVRAD